MRAIKACERAHRVKAVGDPDPATMPAAGDVWKQMRRGRTICVHPSESRWPIDHCCAQHTAAAHSFCFVLSVERLRKRELIFPHGGATACTPGGRRL